MAKAATALESARLLEKHGDYSGAINRAYYACHDAARASLVAVAGLDVRRIKTHNGLVHQFGTHIVKPGLVPPDIRGILGDELDMRLLHDYGDLPASAADAAHAIARAALFVDACRTLLATRSAP